jgi:hypothetical protein
MPYKFHDSRRGKFQKGRYRVMNWPTYKESLRRRGDLGFGGCRARTDGGTAPDARRTAQVFRSCDRNLWDLASCVPPGAAPDSRLCAVNREADGVSPAGAGFLDAKSESEQPDYNSPNQRGLLASGGSTIFRYRSELGECQCVKSNAARTVSLTSSEV